LVVFAVNFDDIVLIRVRRLPFTPLSDGGGEPAVPRILSSPLDTCDVHARLIGEKAVGL